MVSLCNFKMVKKISATKKIVNKFSEDPHTPVVLSWLGVKFQKKIMFLVYNKAGICIP